MVPEDLINAIVDNEAVVEWSHLQRSELKALPHLQLLEDVYYPWILSVRVILKAATHPRYKDENTLGLVAECMHASAAFRKEKGVSGVPTGEAAEKALPKFAEWLNEQEEKTYFALLEAQREHLKYLFNPGQRKELKKGYVELNKEVLEKIDHQRDLLFACHRELDDVKIKYSTDPKAQELRKPALRYLFDRDKDSIWTKRMGLAALRRLVLIRLHFSRDGMRDLAMVRWILDVERYEQKRDSDLHKAEHDAELAELAYERFETEMKGTTWDRLRGIHTETQKKYKELNTKRLALEKDLLEHGTEISKKLKHWEDSIKELAKQHASLMGDDGPKFQIEDALSGLRDRLRKGGLSDEQKAKLDAQLSYGQHVAWGIDREQEQLAVRLIVLEQFIPITVELLAGEIGEQIDITMLKQLSERQLELISKIPKLPKALNVYCTCYNFNFDLVLQFGRLVTDLGKTSYGDWEQHAQRAKVVGWITQAAIGVRTPVVDDIMPGEKLKATKQYSTGTLTLQLTVGLYFGYGDPDSINVKAGCCMVYTASMSHGNDRKLCVSHKLEIKGAVSAQFTAACSASLSATLISTEEANQFTDVFHWAAWLCHRWARLSALYTAWCNVVDPSTLESDRFGTMTEDDKQMLLSAAQQIFSENRKIKRTIEIVSELLTEEPHVIHTQAFNVLSDVSAGFDVTVPSPWKTGEDSKGKVGPSGMKVFGANLSVTPIPETTHYYTYRYKEVDGYTKAIEYKKRVSTVKVQGTLAVLGWSVAVSFQHTMPNNTFISPKGERSLDVALDFDSLFSGDPFGVGQKFGEWVAKWPSAVLFAIPCVMGVASIACASAVGAMEALGKDTKKLKVVTGGVMTGTVASGGGLLAFVKPGQTMGGLVGEDLTKTLGSTGHDLVETILQTLFGVIVAKLFSAKGAKSPIHLFGIPEKPEEAVKDLSKKYANSIDLPLGLWQCRLVESKLDFEKLPPKDRPTEVMWSSVPVLAYWRKYSLSSREFAVPAKLSTIPIPSPAGPFFVKIDLSAKLSLERQFMERIEHNTFQYVQSIYSGLMARRCQKKQRPIAAGGEAIWGDFVKDHQRNLFLLCLYAGCKDMGYQHTINNNKYGSRVYYELLIDKHQQVTGADAFLSECLSMNEHCFKRHPELLKSFQWKLLSLKAVDDLMEAAGPRRISCLKLMGDYLKGKDKVLSEAEAADWHETDSIGHPFHFTTNPVKLVKRISRYAAASGERGLHNLKENVLAHKGKDPVRAAFASAMDFLAVKKEVGELDGQSQKELGLGNDPKDEKQLEKLVEKKGGAQAVLQQISILKAFQGDNYLQLVTRRIQEGAQQKINAGVFFDVFDGEVKAIGVSKLGGSRRILGNHYQGKRTSGVWDRTDFVKESGKNTTILEKRGAKLKQIDEELDKYHSMAWTQGNLDERISCLNNIINLVHAFFTSEPHTKRKAALLTLTEQVCDEIGLFESARKVSHPPKPTRPPPKPPKPKH